MTDNETKLLNFLSDHPFSTYREMVEGVGLSDVTSAVYVVNSLIKKGILRKDQQQKSRAIRITEAGYSQLIQMKNYQIGNMKNYQIGNEIKIDGTGPLYKR